MFLLLLLQLISASHAECTACPVVVEMPDKEAFYGKSRQDLNQYSRDSLMPLISRHLEVEKVPATSIQLKLTITADGRVEQVDFLRFTASMELRQAIEEKIRIMEWHPAEDKGIKVCSAFYWALSRLTSP